ncbi:MAG: HEAT repeat domain-containing protein [Pirellulales bacterium]|nr:HEAT repeat domain-containing protein [Pirellulales bacterium]
MNRSHWGLLGASFLILTMAIEFCCGAQAEPGGQTQRDRESALVAVLQSDAPKAEKALTCKQLAVVGTAKSVPALAKLVADPELTSWARTALEVIPDPSADAALRSAMRSLSGRSLVGVINSLAVRRDAKAVEGIAAHLSNADLQVASAAAVALGKIGGNTAAQVLERALASGAVAVRPAVAQGCILVAEQLLEAGRDGQAAALYDKVRTADVPAQRVREAIRGVILARRSIPLLTEQLRADDEEMFRIGLSTANELASADVTESLVGALDRVSPARQALIVLSLAQRDDDTVLPTILQAASRGSKNVRLNVMQVLGRIGDVTCMQTLLDAAVGADTEISEAATRALGALADPKVDAQVTTRLTHANGRLRATLIDVVGLRRIQAVAELRKAAGDADPAIRSSALMALGATVSLHELGYLIERVTGPQYQRDTKVARKALLTACVRMPDPEACAAQLSSAMSGSSLSAQSALLEILGNVGGATSLATVGKAAAGDQVELKEVASRSLGKWMTPRAAPVLLELAQPTADQKYRIRALRGYLRIARQMKRTDAQRAEMCEQALKVAARDDERLLALKVLEIHPSMDTLVVAATARSIPSIAGDARRVTRAIAQKVGGAAAEVLKLVENEGFSPAKIEIIQAHYGIGDDTKEVTQVVKKSVGRLRIVSLVSPDYNTSFGGDPAPGRAKQLVVKYKINGAIREASFMENAPIILPMP